VCVFIVSDTSVIQGLWEKAAAQGNADAAFILHGIKSGAEPPPPPQQQQPTEGEEGEEEEEEEEEEEAMERYLQRKQAQQQVSAGGARTLYQMRALSVGIMLDSRLILCCVAAAARKALGRERQVATAPARARDHEGGQRGRRA